MSWVLDSNHRPDRELSIRWHHELRLKFLVAAHVVDHLLHLREDEPAHRIRTDVSRVVILHLRGHRLVVLNGDSRLENIKHVRTAVVEPNQLGRYVI